MKNLTYIVLIILSMQSASAQKEAHCFLTGKVNGRDSKQLLLHKTTEDVRNSKIAIPISKDKLFTYNLYYKAIEQYVEMPVKLTTLYRFKVSTSAGAK